MKNVNNEEFFLLFSINSLNILISMISLPFLLILAIHLSQGR